MRGIDHFGAEPGAEPPVLTTACRAGYQPSSRSQSSPMRNGATLVDDGLARLLLDLPLTTRR